MKIYEQHTQENAIACLDYVIEKFPFRLHTIRTDNGHEFQVKFHWHVLDLGLEHVYIKPRTPRLNGKVERSHSTDQQEFYELLSYTDDVDRNAKLMEWESCYNHHRPHGAFQGKTPYEILREKLQLQATSTEVPHVTHKAPAKEVAYALEFNFTYGSQNSVYCRLFMPRALAYRTLRAL